MGKSFILAAILSVLIWQMLMVREAGDTAPDVVEYRHGLTPPMRDARKRRFRREPDLNVCVISYSQNYDVETKIARNILWFEI